MNEKERLSNYDEHYFVGRDNIETVLFRNKALRPGDEWACLCYALGIQTLKEACKILGVPEKGKSPSPVGFAKQVALAKANAKRKPELIIDVGAGRGELTAAFMLCGIRCIAIDPALGALTLIPKTLAEWGNITEFEFLPVGAFEGMKQVANLPVDTVIMCESIEHIREDEFDKAWPIIVKLLRATKGLFIAANWVENHPLHPDRTGYDHIRHVTDAFYDRLAEDAGTTIFRKGSHIVLRF